MKRLTPFLLAAGLLAGAAPLAAERRPQFNDWTDARVTALPSGPRVFRAKGTRLDFAFPTCYPVGEIGEIYDAVPCPQPVLLLAADLRAEIQAERYQLAQNSAAAAVILSDGPNLGDGALEAATPAPKVEPVAKPKRRKLVTPAQRAKLERRLLDELEKQVGDKADASDPLAAPGMWGYYVDGNLLMDAGGTFAMETWDCRLLRGRRCFAGAVAGKKTAGIAIGLGLRSMAAMAAVPEGQRKFQLVVWLGFVLPYDTQGANASPAVGASLKF